MALLVADGNAALIAAEFSRYFSLVPELEAERQGCVSGAFAGGSSIETSFGFEEIRESEVRSAIKSGPGGRSSGVDGISSDKLKLIVDEISGPLAVLFNKLIYKGIFPSSFKEAIIIPVPKAGDLTLVSNYRPISLLPTISKIVESLVGDGVIRFLNEKQFFSERQFGFLPGRSTAQAVVQHVAQVTAAVEKNKHVVAAYLDVSKAFDNVDHD